MKKVYFFYLVISQLLTISVLSVFLIVTEKKSNIERISAYENLLGEVAETAEFAIDDKMESVEISYNNFLKYDNSSIDLLLNNLKKQEELLQRKYIDIYLVTENFYAYSSKGMIEWEDGKIKNEPITFFKKDGVDYIIFNIKIDEPLIVEELSFKYYVHVIPFEKVRPYFGTIGIKQNCYISILEPTGNILFNFNSNVKGNLFDYLLSHEKENGYTIQNIIYEIKNDIKGCKKIKMNVEDFYISYQKLNDWDLIIICPDDLLYSEQYNYTPLIRVFFAILTGIIFFSSVNLIHILVKYSKDKKVYAYQRHVNTELEVAVNEANKANAAKSDFLSRISHDIRTPMNGIIGMTNIAKNNIDDKQKVSYCLNKIYQASDHLLTLLNNVLDLSKIESGVIQLKYSPVNMIELLQTCKTMLVAQSESMLLKLETNFNLIHDYIMIDEVRLKQVLINILSNAVKFNNLGGSIEFSAFEEKIDDSKSKYYFEVQDSGVGMNQEFLEQIFDPFVQEDQTDARTKYKGSGLGMSIVKELVELMQGQIIIDSKVGVGTKITVIIETEFLKDETELNAKLIEYEKLSGMKILLVEDNEINMEIAETLLQEVGVDVDKAYNGQEAINMFNESPVNYYEAILMDILMPIKNGYEASSEIRNGNRPDRNLPIIAMTANAYNEDKEKAYEAGMDSHVAKPIQIEKLYDILLNYKK